MAATVEKFVGRCMDIVKARPTYKLGCSSTTSCDCIGMVKYSLRENEVSFSTTGTNWTMRYQTKNVREISSASVLKVGDIVFKARKPGDTGYNLPGKYQKGGSAYNGDLNDYCHIGVVKSVSPLRIIHMTSPTAKTDTAVGKWAYAAELLDKLVDYGGTPTPEPQPSPDPEPSPAPETDTAIVVAAKGSTVKMRAKPSRKCKLYDDVPVGSTVTVVEHGYEWTKINYGRRKGWYMMTVFLKSTE